MLKIVKIVCIDETTDKVWSVLTDIENISQWSEAVLSASISSDIKKGVGTERICHLKNNIAITERWVTWDEGKSFTYEGFGLPLVKSARNKWTVIAENGKSLLKTESEIVIKGGVFGKLLQPLMRIMVSRMGSDALAAFKYLVENGHAFEGRHSKLPRVLPTC